MIATIVQALILTSGAVAIWLAGDDRPGWRAAAPFVGVAGQPFWLWATWDAGQWGMLGLSIAYTLAWGRGVVGVLRDRAAVRVAAEIRRNRDGRG